MSRKEMDPNGEEGERVNMEKKAKECLELSEDESEAVSRIVFPAQRLGESSIYDVFSLRGIRVDRAEPGLVVCTLKVPPRLTVSNTPFFHFLFLIIWIWICKNIDQNRLF